MIKKSTGRENSRRGGRRQMKKWVAICVIVGLFAFAIIKFRNNYNDSDNVTAEQLMEENYPKSLIELMQNHPETKQFVIDYKKNKDKTVEIDLTGEITKGKIPLFLQWDERWGYKTYGDDFLAITGCGPTCLSMVRCGLSGNTKWNPYKVACMADEQGYYVAGAGSSWELMTTGAEKLGLTVNNVTFTKEHIRSELEIGNPIICIVGPGDFTTTGHFIVLSDIDEEGNVTVRDPNSRYNSNKTWDIEEVMSQIRNLWSYSLEG